MLKTVKLLFGAMLVLLGLSSCLEMEAKISLKKDGSGTLTETVKIGAQMAGMMAGQGEEAMAQFGEEAQKEKAAAYGEGVTFGSTKKVEAKDGSIAIVTVFNFANISTLAFNPGAMMDSEADPAEGEKIFSYKDGELTISIPDPSEEEFNLGGEEMGEEEMAMAAPMLAGMKMSAKLVLEGGIAETNATYRDGDEIILMSMNFDEVMKNEEGLKTLSKLDVDSREEFGKLVKGVKGLQVEFLEKVTVKFN